MADFCFVISEHGVLLARANAEPRCVKLVRELRLTRTSRSRLLFAFCDANVSVRLSFHVCSSLTHVRNEPGASGGVLEFTGCDV